MSTFAHVMSFPFWFFGVVFLIAAVTNSLTLHFGDFRRKATLWERACIATASAGLLAIAFFLTSL